DKPPQTSNPPRRRPFQRRGTTSRPAGALTRDCRRPGWVVARVRKRPAAAARSARAPGTDAARRRGSMPKTGTKNGTSRRRPEQAADLGPTDGAPEVQAEPEETDDMAPREAAPTITSELRDAVREAAVEVLKPIARKATVSAAKYAVSRGPDMVKDKGGDGGGAGWLGQ